MNSAATKSPTRANDARMGHPQVFCVNGNSDIVGWATRRRTLGDSSKFFLMLYSSSTMPAVCIDSRRVSDLIAIRIKQRLSVQGHVRRISEYALMYPAAWKARLSSDIRKCSGQTPFEGNARIYVSSARLAFLLDSSL